MHSYNFMRYIKISVGLLFVVALNMARAGSFSYPDIKPCGTAIGQFVPPGWKVIDSAFGDLNKDKAGDMALVIQHNDSIALVDTGMDGQPDTVFMQPRILAIFFYDKVTRQYRLIEQSNSFIVGRDNPYMDEPFRGILIARGVLSIQFFLWYSAGSWEMSNHAYKFRYQNNQFELIGADYLETNRASGKTNDRSYNFVTQKVKVSTGNISNNRKKVTYHNIAQKEMKTLKTFEEPFTWEVENGFYL